MVAVSIALVVGVGPVATAGNPEAPPAYAVVPVQLSMGHPGPAARKRMSAPAKPVTGLTPEEYRRRLDEAMKRMTPQERKRVAKAVKRMTPEERRQLEEAVKRQLSGKKTAQHLIKRAR